MPDNFIKHVPHKKKRSGRILEALRDSDLWPAPVQFFFLPRQLSISNFFILRIGLWILLAYFTITVLIYADKAWIVEQLHSLNLLIHEAGHPIFSVFQVPVLTSLGGSLFQVLIPVICGFALWIKPRDLFGASVAFGWAFENLIDIYPYIADALAMRLTLISGDTGNEAPYGFHDWNFILSETGHLLACEKIASTVHIIGLVGMILCLIWGLWSLLYYILFQKE